MFTGIIEETGKVSLLNNQAITILCNKVLENTLLGDSITVNGVCLTVTNISNNSFSADISATTLEVTNFSELQINSIVNLERALTLNTRLGGHIVSGHIDGTARVIFSRKSGEFLELGVKIPENLTKYIIKKGSITINGISLTVADIDNSIITIAVIPHTISKTNLLNLKTNDIVNIEVDVLAKYTEKLLLSNKTNNQSNITMDLLTENGFV